jgi:hypothetical protein
MWPERSKQFALPDAEIPRLVLASNWQLLLIAVLVLALLVVIFPRKTLVEKLYAQQTLDELTQSYVQNLYRADTQNADIAVLLARSQQDKLDLATLERMLLGLTTTGDARQRNQARLMLAKAYLKALSAQPDKRETLRVSAQLTTLMKQAEKEEIPPALSRIFAAAAFELSSPRLGFEFLERVAGGSSVDVMAQRGREALAQGDHSLAAQYFLMAREQVKDPDQARVLFKQGIDALMAASQFKEAMLAAEQHIGDLGNDAPTLRYLARTALAAGQPVQAAHYARRLVFQSAQAVRTP